MFKFESKRHSVMAQWLGSCAFIAEGVSLIPDWRMKILQATECGQKFKNVGSKHGRTPVHRRPWDLVFTSRCAPCSLLPVTEMELHPGMTFPSSRRCRGKGQRRKRLLKSGIESQVSKGSTPGSCSLSQLQGRLGNVVFVLDSFIRQKF